MKIKPPTSEEIEKLIAFLPLLYAKDFTPIKRWRGGKKQKDGSITLPWPEYNNIVEDFFRVITDECWRDYDYSFKKVIKILERNNVFKTASLSEIKAILTHYWHGERFCDGYWAGLIENKSIYHLLNRLSEFRETTSNKKKRLI